MIIENQTFDQERALYGLKELTVKNCRFDGPADGESAFKECRNIDVSGCYMNLRYPFWHVEKAKITDTSFTENCRAALWYDKDILIENCRLGGIKALRECENISLKKCSVNSIEFAWKSQNLKIENVTIEESEYPFFEIHNAEIKGLSMKGKYSFQYSENLEITDSELNTKDAFWHTKDAFWHTKNVTVKNSLVKSEYLGWYSENLTLINCRIIGTQPFCYCKNLVLKNCTMEECDLAFERSSINVDVSGKIDSIKNPLQGKITADSIGQIILEDQICDKSKTQIICRK